MLRLTLTALVLLGASTSALAASENSAVATTTLTTAVAPSVNPTTAERPALLPALYVSFAALQAFDAVTTSGALTRGAREVNPILARGNMGYVWAVKAVSTASTIYFVERLWKQNRIAAMVVMAGINGGYVAIAAHNVRRQGH